MCNALQRRPSAPAQCAVPLANACSSSRQHTRVRASAHTRRHARVALNWFPHRLSSSPAPRRPPVWPATRRRRRAVSLFKDMPGAYAGRREGPRRPSGSRFPAEVPDLVQWVQEAEIKQCPRRHACCARLPGRRVFHPLCCSITEPSLIAFQATPLRPSGPLSSARLASPSRPRTSLCEILTASVLNRRSTSRHRRIPARWRGDVAHLTHWLVSTRAHQRYEGHGRAGPPRAFNEQRGVPVILAGPSLRG